MRLFFLALACGVRAFSQGPALFGFLPNTGQFPPAVRFVRHSSYGNFFYLTRDALVLRNRVRIQIAGIDPKAEPVAEAPSQAIHNSYRGNSPFRWQGRLPMYGAVRLNNVYPGVTAAFTASTLEVSSPLSIGQGKVIFSVAPGADPGLIRLRVLNTGTVPFEGPGGIWFAGGSIPGVFTVSASAAQSGVAIASQLKIESPDTLSVQLPSRDASLPATVVIAFPNYDLIRPSLTPGPFFTARIEYPSNFGEDGGSNDCGNRNCSDALVARLDDEGKPLWVTTFGGGGDDEANVGASVKDGVVVAGNTASSDFPVVASAPHPAPGSANADGFLAFFDAASGALRSATYLGLKGSAWVQQLVAEAGGDVAVSGGYAATSTESRGYVQRWRPAENRFIYSLLFDSPVASLAFDASSNLYYGAAMSASILAGAVDPAGLPLGTPARIPVPAGLTAFPTQVLPAGGNEFWVAYAARLNQSHALPSVYVARISLSRGQVLVNRRVATQGNLANLGLTPFGNLKLLIRDTPPTEPTTDEALLSAACADTSYIAILTPEGRLRYGSYVPNANLDFSKQNEIVIPYTPWLACFAGAANRFPSASAAPGELITLTGGFPGYLEATYTAPGPDGKYPITAGGIRVRIAGFDAPIIAYARGLIAVQVPYETASLPQSGPPEKIEAFINDGQSLNSIPIRLTTSSLTLFDTGDRNNVSGLSALAALNQDGTVNSAQNPAQTGSVVSLFGSGLGVVSPPLETGALSPIPPAAPLSTSRLFKACQGCSEILYLGSAPGLSTSVVQINLRIPPDAPGTGVRPQTIGVGVAESVKALFPSVGGVVFIR